MEQLKVLALTSGEGGRNIDVILESEFINRMATLKPVNENLERASTMPVDAAVLYTPHLTDQEAAFMERLYMVRDKLALILITDCADAETFSKAMGSGIRKVFGPDTSDGEICSGISEEVSKLKSRMETAEVREYDSRIMSVFSTKGGTGKTTVAVNLASAMQNAGKRVAVVDLDLQFGDVGIFMNVPRCDTISDLAGENSLSPSVINSFLYRHSNGVRVLCAPPSPELAELVTTDKIDRILTVLRAEFDWVICDLSPALDDVTLFALDRSDTVLFVTNPEIPTLKNTRTCLGILKILGHASKIHLVLNRDGDPFVSRADVKNALDEEAEFFIPTDPKSASSSVNRGVPVVSAYPKSKISRAFEEMARDIAFSSDEEPGKKKKGLFRR